MQKLFIGMLIATGLCGFAVQASAQSGETQDGSKREEKRESKRQLGVYLDLAGTITTFPSDGAAAMTGTNGKGGLVGAGVQVWDIVVGGDIGDQILSVPDVPSLTFTHISVYAGFKLPLNEDFSLGVNVGTTSVKGALMSGGEAEHIGDGKFIEAIMVVGKTLGFRASVRHYINDPNGPDPSPFKDMILVGARLSF